MLGIRQVHIGDNIYDTTVGLLRKALILAAVTGLHVEDRNVKAFGTDN